ncbi:D-threo-3-hydroxyaspartate dehydratase-like [Schistocerca cancellata]|uniref:D-threo-3-hydroxyaspartate dehydratase-like n=1 Tax=Schistocerca cancellata TaxID=274614 RepID=UPI002119AADB|nr:D-threo-3-hydroxyaspartate dehydratase-like [Schistocerca cancellata]
MEFGSWTPPKSYVGKHLSDIPTPAFIVDKEKVVRNCHNMLKKCAELHVKLRPHMNTHKTEEAALLQTGGQKKCITVSTFREAEFFADRGWDDILVALPLAPFHLARVKTLANRVSTFHLLVDNVDSAAALAQLPTPPGKTAWSVFIKVDAGYARAGVRWSDTHLAVRICEALHPKVMLQGLYAYCGNSYNTNSPTDILAVRHRTAERILKLSKELVRKGFTCPTVSVGSTPSMSISISAEARRMFMKLNEVHPGHYVFYDLQQASLGCCSLDDVACRIMTRVIGHYPHRKQMLIDCGFTALTKQGLNANKIVSGYAVFEYHPHLKLIEITQEVGKVEAVDDALDVNRYPIGTVLFLYPYQACAAAALHPVYYIHKDDVVQEEWRPVRGW